MTRRDYAADAARLQDAVDAVYDAHGVDDPRRRPVLANHPMWGNYGALAAAKVIADAHVYHDGLWEAGSCDGELFALEWVIFDIETPEPKRPPLWRRVLGLVS